MRNIVEEVVEYLQTGVPGPTLAEAEHEYGKLDLRLFCINLASWWGRGTLMKSRHPYMQIQAGVPWHERFRIFVASVSELRELVQFKDDGCHFSEAIPREEWQAINDFVRANYKPRVFR